MLASLVVRSWIIGLDTTQSTANATKSRTVNNKHVPNYTLHTLCNFSGGGKKIIKRIIIMYIYHALINALSAHMIHINLVQYSIQT